MAFQGQKIAVERIELKGIFELRLSKLSEQGMGWDRVERRMPPVCLDEIVVIVRHSRRAVVRGG